MPSRALKNAGCKKETDRRRQAARARLSLLEQQNHWPKTLPHQLCIGHRAVNRIMYLSAFSTLPLHLSTLQAAIYSSRDRPAFSYFSGCAFRNKKASKTNRSPATSSSSFSGNLPFVKFLENVLYQSHHVYRSNIRRYCSPLMIPVPI
jgi:hypothetical protein